jgi:hypothetical protein
MRLRSTADSNPLTRYRRAAVTRFSEFRAEIGSRTILPWGEHCTECAWPTCYTTCELYSPRIDGNCRLFVDGMVRVDLDDSASQYLLKLRFKRWGKLWTVGNLAMHELCEAEHKERRNMLIGGLARSIPLPRPLKSRAMGKVAYLRRRAAETSRLPSTSVWLGRRASGQPRDDRCESPLRLLRAGACSVRDPGAPQPPPRRGRRLISATHDGPLAAARERPAASVTNDGARCR